MIQFVIVPAKQILKPEDAHSAESCPRKYVAHVCHAMKRSEQDTQQRQDLLCGNLTARTGIGLKL